VREQRIVEQTRKSDLHGVAVRVSGFGFRGLDLGFRISADLKRDGYTIRVQGVGCRVQGAGCRVWGVGCRV
jgi:hypothetical protein